MVVLAVIDTLADRNRHLFLLIPALKTIISDFPNKWIKKLRSFTRVRVGYQQFKPERQLLKQDVSASTRPTHGGPVSTLSHRTFPQII